MRYFYTIIFYLLSSFLFYSCSNEKRISDEEKFAAVYVDLLINDETNPGDSVKIKAGQLKIFEKYNTSYKEYKATIDYYNKDPERWRDFFTKVNEYYEKVSSKPISR